MNTTISDAISAFGLPLIQILRIVWIDVLLSGDNAIVIALACRSLPPAKRRVGIIAGAGCAIVLRVLLTLTAQYALGLPHLKIIAGVLLFWIAIKLLVSDSADDAEVTASNRLIDAIRTIVVADVIMSIDNVLAVASAAGDNPWLVAFGLVLSLPLVVVGATAIMTVLTRYPILVWLGSGLLGWVAGELMFEDPNFMSLLLGLTNLGAVPQHWLANIFAGVAALMVILLGFLLVRPERTRPD
jgi:YjbE family integral membrane protein